MSWQKSYHKYRRKVFRSLLKAIRRKFQRSSLFPVLIISFGLTLFIFPPLVRVYNNFQLGLSVRAKQDQYYSLLMGGPIKIASELTTISAVIGDFPIRIVIPQQQIDLPVKVSKVINGVWEVHNNVANFGWGSSLPDENGNTVIFAHAKWGLFLPLRNIKKGEIISLQTKEGQWFTYQVFEVKEVDPDQVEFISQTNDKTLTLFTCSGFADSKRLIIIAKAQV